MQFAIAGLTTCTRFPDTSKSVKFFDRSATVASTSRTKHPPMFNDVKRFNLVNTAGMTSNLL